jgi:iron(III) transport system ATP-binding protein
MVFQEYALFPHLTVAENIAFGLPKGSNRQKRVAEVLALVGLANLQSRMPHELSGGQQQRVALARALAPNPALILLDEPFSNLDAGLRGQVRAEVRRILRQAQATVIFVTHDQEEALNLADEVAVMLNGQIVQTDVPQRLYQHPVSRQVATFVGEANFLTGQVRAGRVTCEIGEFEVNTALSGPVEIMLRPEDIGLDASENGRATVLDRQYFGHDQLVHIRLESGLRLSSRLLSSAGDFEAGQRVDWYVSAQRLVLFPA